jgi:hypothetical protein
VQHIMIGSMRSGHTRRIDTSVEAIENFLVYTPSVFSTPVCTRYHGEVCATMNFICRWHEASMSLDEHLALMMRAGHPCDNLPPRSTSRRLVPEAE